MGIKNNSFDFWCGNIKLLSNVDQKILMHDDTNKIVKYIPPKYIYLIMWIIIVHGEPMLVAFLDNPCPQIYTPTNVQYIYKHLFNTFWNYPEFATDDISSPWTRKILAANNIDPTNENDSTA